MMHHYHVKPRWINQNNHSNHKINFKNPDSFSIGIFLFTVGEIDYIYEVRLNKLLYNKFSTS